MNILLLGAAGFLGTNLTISLAKNTENNLTLFDTNKEYFESLEKMQFNNVVIRSSEFNTDTDFISLTKGQDLVYHLVSTTVPSTSNLQIPIELELNVIATSKLLEACVTNRVGKIVFLSSGGTVYGKSVKCPITEKSLTNPITSYGIQKVTIENLLYLYNYMYGLDYRIIRLSNPYGPYQRPNGLLGAVTTFTYKALRREKITVFGDGSIVRDFIYVDDAIKAIIKITQSENKYKLYNLGCGYGTSIKQVLDTIHCILEMDLDIDYRPNRKVDVPENYLNISRYEEMFGELKPLSIYDGIIKTIDFMKKHYDINTDK